jgi:hypothetical protein
VGNGQYGDGLWGRTGAPWAHTAKNTSTTPGLLDGGDDVIASVRSHMRLRKRSATGIAVGTSDFRAATYLGNLERLSHEERKLVSYLWIDEIHPRESRCVNTCPRVVTLRTVSLSLHRAPALRAQLTRTCSTRLRLYYIHTHISTLSDKLPVLWIRANSRSRLEKLTGFFSGIVFAVVVIAAI